MNRILSFLKKLIPEKLYRFFQPIYHLKMSFLAALFYRFPSKKLIVIGVTGTKGKSTTVELISAIFEAAGFTTAVTGTVRFKIGDKSWDNTARMSMPGRFFMQKFLRKAVQAKCQVAIVEMTSEGARQYRHRFICLDALVFTNLKPEHIESHGSYEKYRDAKVSLAKALEKSTKARRVLIANIDDPESVHFLNLNIPEKITYGKKDILDLKLTEQDIAFTWNGVAIHSPLSGLFNAYNMLAAASTAKAFAIGNDAIQTAFKTFRGVRGRVEKVYPQNEVLREKQNFTVIVDYAHTPDSLEKLYEAFGESRKICGLGATGGGRDKWKRAEMGKIAATHCDDIILTNEDPYDEKPEDIIADIAKGIPSGNYTVIVDRREAIREALKRADIGDAVLITGKGTDPTIQGPNGTSIPWSDAKVTREELDTRLS